VTDEDLLDVFRATSDPVLSTAEVADAVPIKRRGTLNRLQALEADGELASKQIGGRNTVWWFVGGERITPDERASETDAETARTIRDRREDTAARPPEAPESNVLGDAVDVIAEDTLPGSGAKLESRREALQATVDYLREQGQATPKDFRTNVYPDYTGHYTDGDDPARSWWKNCIYKGLRELAEQTDLVEKADTSGEWSWRGAS
jgi:predicted ArsR family transcriptional regulator